MPTTPRGLLYPDSSGHTRIWDHIHDLATSIETALDVIDIVHAGSGNNLDATSTPQPSQPTTLKIITGRLSATISGGLLSFTFPGSGFPNGVLAILATTISGTPGAPVINSANITKTGGQFFVPSATYGSGLTGPCVVSYVAIGY